MDRRSFVRAAVTMTAGALLGAAGSTPPQTRLVLLGTGGGPRPRKQRSAPAQVILVGEDAYVIDCGDGVARQLVLAGVPLSSIRHVFITHHHSDHNADYGNLLLLAWAAGLRTAVNTWGPPPLLRMTELLLEANAYDIRTRIADEGRMPLTPLVRPHELTHAGEVMRNGRMKVTAAVVNHPPVSPAFAFRFDTPDRSIVISGDTTYSEELIKLAADVDVLVHEALFPPAVDRLVAAVPNAPDLKRSILSHHTPATDVGRIAQKARAKLLVLSHLVPSEDPEVTERMWLEAASAHFKGPIIVGRDLLEI